MLLRFLVHLLENKKPRTTKLLVRGLGFYRGFSRAVPLLCRNLFTILLIAVAERLCRVGAQDQEFFGEETEFLKGELQ